MPLDRTSSPRGAHHAQGVEQVEAQAEAVGKDHRQTAAARGGAVADHATEDAEHAAEHRAAVLLAVDQVQLASSKKKIRD